MKLEASDIQPGDELYISDVWSIDNGWTDQCGGIAVVERIQHDNHGNVFAHFKGLKHHAPNLKYILEEQEKWEKEYGDKLAHDCPEGTKCPNPRRPCQGCSGVGCVCCNWTGKGAIKKSPARQLLEAMKEAKKSAFRSKLMREARREI